MFLLQLQQKGPLESKVGKVSATGIWEYKDQTEVRRKSKDKNICKIGKGKCGTFPHQMTPHQMPHQVHLGATSSNVIVPMPCQATSLDKAYHFCAITLVIGPKCCSMRTSLRRSFGFQIEGRNNKRCSYILVVQQ